MYHGYQALAGVYDCLNREIDYERWSGFLESCFDRFLPARPRIVLDLACGTGRMTFPLADRGYDMIGIDGSEDMLAEAYRKSTERTIRIMDEAGTDELPAGITTPLFLCQDMRNFELYGTVDAAVCCLDSINYLCGDGDLDACLSCLYLYIAPGGLLVFDVNSPATFENIYGRNAYILEDSLPSGGTAAETRDVYCGWQNEYSPATHLCRFFLSVFREDGDGRYTRTDEEQTERCYSRKELETALNRAGFDLCGMFGGFDFAEATDSDPRWYIAARTRKTGDWYLCTDAQDTERTDCSHE